MPLPVFDLEIVCSRGVAARSQALSAACKGEYGLACEHEHSCCILLARTARFWRENTWHTWINYDRFQVQKEGENRSSAAPNNRTACP